MHLAKAKKLKKNSSLPERGRSADRGGFTLMELMMAIGILGIGMVMAASLFPAALKENQLSNDDVIGEMICKNGLNMGKIHYTADTPENKPSEVHGVYLNKNSCGIDELHEDRISKENQHYPIGEANANLGYALLARKIAPSANDPAEGYQLVCAAYRKRGGTDKTVTWQYVKVNTTFETENSVSVVTVTQYETNLRTGSPMVFWSTGEFGIITKVDGNKATLNCKLGNRLSNDYYAFVLVESGEDEFSPAIFVMSTRTGLQE